MCRKRWQTAESVVLEVRDTGIGIPEDKLDDIFVAFEQVLSLCLCARRAASGGRGWGGKTGH